jgi:ATP-dependent exoDNAse (exonuclease V) beta subunit
MNIDYSITKNIKVDTLPTGRIYHTPDGSFSSITTILGKTSSNQIWLAKWKERVGHEEANKISKEATDRGELVHSYLEKYWNGENILEKLNKEPIRVRGPALSLIKGTSNNITKVYAQEIPVWSSKLKYSGRVDMIGLWNDIPSIIDFKTSKKSKLGTQIKDYFIQASGYAYAHNELFNTSIQKIVIIIAVDDKIEPQIFEQKANIFIPELKNRIKTYEKTTTITL